MGDASRDLAMMRRAIALSRRGWPAPNPHVGCVLAQGDTLVGEGYHRRAGEDHAEVMALKAAGASAKGATAYVTLEPCNHTGRTGPCSHALLMAGVTRVVYAVSDPNPHAAGGHAYLESHGVRVEVGLLAAEAERVNEVFLWSERTGLPFVCLKAGVSLDGRIALPSGESQWITGETSRRAVQRLRAKMGAVLVGPRTAALDNPSLLPRFRGAPEVVRVVLDSRGNLPSSLQVFDGKPRTIHVVPKGAPCHAERLELEATSDPAALLAELKRRGMRGLLVEGGAQTHALFLPFARRIELFVSGVALGAGPAWLGDYGVAQLGEARRFKVDRVTRLGEDVRLCLRP